MKDSRHNMSLRQFQSHRVGTEHGGASWQQSGGRLKVKRRLVLCAAILLCAVARASELDWQNYDRGGWRLLEEGRYEQSIKLFQAALAELDRLGLKDHRRGRTLAGLAWAQWHSAGNIAGDAAREKAYQDVLTSAEGALPLLPATPTDAAQRLLRAKNCHVLGKIYVVLARYKDATTQLQDARDLYNRLGNQPSGAADVLADLGDVHTGCLGLKEALESYHQAFAEWGRVSPRTDALAPQAALVVRQIPAFLLTGNYTSAAALQMRWEQLRQQRQRNGRPVGEAEFFHARVLFAQLNLLRGDLSQAEQLLKATTGCNARCPLPHCRCDKLVCLTWARLELERGKYEDARERLKCLDDAAQRDAQLEGEKKETLGWIDLWTGQYDEALKDFEAARETLVQQLGAKDPQTAGTLLGLAWTHLAKGDKQQQVVKLLDDVIGLHQSLGSSSHPDIAFSLRLRAMRSLGRGDTLEAWEASEASERRLQVALLPSHPHRGASVLRHALATWAAADFKTRNPPGPDGQEMLKRADLLADQAYDALRPVVSQHHPLLAWYHVTKGWIAHSRGCLDEAERSFDCAQTAWSKPVAGEEHPDLFEALLGKAAVALGRYGSIDKPGAKPPRKGKKKESADGKVPVPKPSDPLQQAQDLMRRAAECLEGRYGSGAYELGLVAFEFSRRGLLLRRHQRFVEAWWFYDRSLSLYQKLADRDPQRRPYLKVIQDVMEEIRAEVEGQAKNKPAS